MLMIYFGHAEGEAEQVASLIMAGAAVVAYIIGEGLADAGNGVMTIEGGEGKIEKLDEKK